MIVADLKPETQAHLTYAECLLERSGVNVECASNDLECAAPVRRDPPVGSDGSATVHVACIRVWVLIVLSSCGVRFRVRARGGG